MSQVNLQDWVEDIQLRLPGLTTKVAEHQLFATAQEFFRESLSWVVRVPYILDSTKQYIYLSPSYDGGVVGTILSVSYEDYPLGAYLQQPTPDSSPSTPRGFYAHDTGTIELFPTLSPAVDGKILYVEVALLPATIDTRIPADIWNLYRDALICGTLSRLLEWSGRPWHDDKRAVLEARKYRKFVLQARKSTLSRFSKGASSFRYPAWA